MIIGLNKTLEITSDRRRLHEGNTAMSFGFLVVVIGADYMREIQLCPLGFLVVVIGTDYMREIQLCSLVFLW